MTLSVSVCLCIVGKTSPKTLSKELLAASLKPTWRQHEPQIWNCFPTQINTWLCFHICTRWLHFLRLFFKYFIAVDLVYRLRSLHSAPTTSIDQLLLVRPTPTVAAVSLLWVPHFRCHCFKMICVYLLCIGCVSVRVCVCQLYRFDLQSLALSMTRRVYLKVSALKLTRNSVGNSHSSK